MPSYNPFDRDFNQLSLVDLKTLIDQEIAEGWYIEYKGQLNSDSKKIAKSISAFANSEGGWYFVGVESDDKTNVATNICGIEISKEKNVADRLSAIISSNISPLPLYEIRTVTISDTHAVVIIKVESGQEPPYVTSSGSIHQREYNANNPVSDRFIIEKMYEKSKLNKDRIEKFSQTNYTATKGQKDNDIAHLELFLFPSPFTGYDFSDFFKPSFFQSIATKFFNGAAFRIPAKGEPISIPVSLGFNSIHSSFDSLVLRPVQDNQIIYRGTTVELFRNGSLKLLLPLHQFSLSNIPSRYEKSEVLAYFLERFSPFHEVEKFPSYPFDRSDATSYKVTERKKSDFVDYFRFIDGQEVLLVTFFIVKIYQDILAANGYKRLEIGFRGRITNCWRKSVFFDNQNFLNAIKKYNVPTSPKSEIEFPAFQNGNYIKLATSEYSFVTLCEHIFEAIGIPRIDLKDYMDILETAFVNLTNKNETE